MTEKNNTLHMILRLNTGEDIIGYCLLDDEDEVVLITNPMRVIMRRMPDVEQTVLMMAPWLPLELVEEDIATINYNDIITMVTPKASFIEYYDNTVDKYQAVMAQRQDQLFDDYEMEEEDSEDAMLDEILNMEPEKNQLLH